MSRNKWFPLIVTATCLVALASIALTRVRASEIQGKAFTIRYVEHSGINGNAQPGQDRYFSKRSDGSTVESRMMPAPDNHDYAQRIIRDTSKGVRVAVDEATDSITTYPLTAKEVETLKHSPVNCTSDETAEHSIILGYSVVRQVLPVPSRDKRRVETWFASDLGCAVLRQSYFGYDQNAKDVLLSSKEATSIAVGDPDASLFEIPNWQERSPSEVMAEFSRRFHLKNLPLSPQHPTGANDAYHAAQQRRH